MTVGTVSKDEAFGAVFLAEEKREINGVYCCDLLSLAMARAPQDSAWVTVMGNLNAVAVASLCDVACIVVAQGMPVDEAALVRAKEQGISIFKTDLPVFDAALRIHSAL